MIYFILILAAISIVFFVIGAKQKTVKESPTKTKEQIRNELEEWKKIRADLLNGNVIFFDTETTGTDMSGKDEILSLAIVDKEGNILFNELIKPSARQRWPKAQEINGITPAMVKDKKKIGEYQEQIQRIFDAADLVVGYNTEFDLSFIRNAGIQYAGRVADVMLDYAEINGEWDDKHAAYRWKKLNQCAAHYGYDWGQTAAHDALADTLATRYCFYKIVEQKGDYHTYKM